MDLLSIEEKKYLKSRNYEKDFPQLEETLTEPRFLISELGVSARDATYWDKQGILPETKGIGARRKYDLVQSIWIKLIQQLRSFGVPISLIKKVKDELLNFNINLTSLFETPKVKEVIQAIIEAGGYDGKLEDIINSGNIKNLLKDESIDLFKTIIKSIVIFRKPISILVLKEGQIIPYAPEQHNYKNEFNETIKEALNKPHISLSITTAYSELVQDWSSKPFFEEISLLSTKEIEIFNAIREPNLKSVKIKYSGGEIDLMEVVKNEKISTDKKFLEVISSNGFHTITVKSRNGNIVHYENAQMRKIKSVK